MARNIILIILVVLALGIIAAGIYLVITISRDEKAPEDLPLQIKTSMKHLITLRTNYGVIQFTTYDEDAPKAVNNFITLAQKGFYNGLSFHRVIKDFMIQGGDPNCKPATVDPKTGGLKLEIGNGPCGAGGPGYQFDDELNPNASSYQEGYQKGVVAMANSGPNTNGSQFFIMLKNNPGLPHNYTIFGKVVNGQDVVDAIGAVQTDPKDDRPAKPVVMDSVSIESVAP